MNPTALTIPADPIVTLIDGRAATAIGVLDRGLHYGDGLFETIACRAGVARFLDLHLQRLSEGCARLRIRYGDFPGLAVQIRELAASRASSIIKLMVTRGDATARGYATRGDEQPHAVLLQYAWAPEDPRPWEQGVAVRIAAGRLGENPALAGLKHLNRLEQVLVRSEWTDPGIHEALVFSSSGALVSGTMSNVFLVMEGRLVTPALTHAGVRGVMRAVVMREAQRHGLNVMQTTLDAAALDVAEEIFLTNARIGIWPVCALDGRARVVGPLTRQLQQWLLPWLEAPAAASDTLSSGGPGDA